MEVGLTVDYLKQQRKLLLEFCEMSEKYASVAKAENSEAVTRLLDRRADIMLELSAIGATMQTWIDQISTQLHSRVSNEILDELGQLNAEIVSLANEVVAIDDRTLRS